LKRIFSLLIIMSLFVLALCATAFGAEANVIDEKALLQPDTQVVQLNEYELFKQKQAETDEELAQRGLSADQIKELRNFDYPAEIRKRAMLNDTELAKMGYDSESIAELRSFDGSEEQTYALTASLSLSCNINNYFYSNNRTNAVISYNWSWDSMPFWTMTDILAIAWDPSMYQTPDNYNDKQVISCYIGSTYAGTYTTPLSPEVPGGAASCSFPVLVDEFSDMWAKSATGNVYLSASGYVANFATRVAYGHSTLYGSPSVSFPGGVSITFGGSADEEAADYDYKSL